MLLAPQAIVSQAHLAVAASNVCTPYRMQLWKARRCWQIVSSPKSDTLAT